MQRAFVDTGVILRILISDGDQKGKAGEKLLKEAKGRGIALHLLRVSVMEVVFVLDKVYKLGRKRIQEMVCALLDTPELSVDMEHVFRQALNAYAEKNINFADE